MFARACRRSVAADDKFLLVHAFQFDPSPAAAAGFVNGIALLAEKTFQATPFNFREQCLCFSPKRSRKPNDVAQRGDQSHQHFFPQGQRETYQTAAIQLQDIEHVKCQRRIFAIKLGPLQKLKRRAPLFIHRDDFAVDHAFIGLKTRSSAGDFREAIVQLFFIA